MNDFLLRKLLNFWPPFLGAGIRVKKINKDFTSIDVEMKLRFWNKNAAGSHYGGSLFSMSDPFYVLILMKNLGPDYIVWDKASVIHFKKPGQGTVRTHITLTKETIEDIRKQADTQDKVEPSLRIDIRDKAGNIVAEVEKTLYVRRKARR